MPDAEHLTSRRRLGWTDLAVSPLALGTMQFGWTMSDVDAMALLDAYVAAGGNFLDTADMYGPNQNWRSYQKAKPHLGVSEDIIGRWLKHRCLRDDLVVATKVRAPMWDGIDGEGLSRRHIVRAVEDSLRRLRIDVIDLYQAHWPDPQTPIEETWAAFEELTMAGKVRYVGVSNYEAVGQLDEVLAVTATPGAARLACVQPRYNLVNRAEYETRLQTIVTYHQLGVICYSPLASGFLAGRYRRQQPEPSSPRARYVAQYATPEGWALLDELDHVADRHAVSTSAVALAWIMAQPGITAPIVGATSVAQLREWLPAGDLSLDPSDTERLAQLGWNASKAEYTSW